MSNVQELQATAPVRPETTSEERTWAALAHASTLLTLVLAVGTAGIGGLLAVFVPLAIYLIYKDKSRFVAFHAAQAFALQIAGSVGFFVAIIASVIVIVLAWVITGLLSAILIGLILIPVALLLTLALVLALVAAPLVLGGFSLVAAIQTGSGDDYYYPYLGRWVADWLASTRTAAPPAV